MKITIGTRVKLLHTPDQGVVKAILGNDMLSVYLEGADMEIPVFKEDLLIMEDVFFDYNIKNKVEKIEKKPEILPKIVKNKIHNHGILITFDPFWNHLGEVDIYKIYIINDTAYDVVLNATFWLKNQKKASLKEHFLAKGEQHILGELRHDELNENPELEWDCMQLTTEGKHKNIAKKLKIKPQQFFKNYQELPIFNRAQHVFKLIDRFEQKDDKSDDLITYTQKNVQPIKKTHHKPTKLELHDVHEVANFSIEIDLHIEALTASHHKLTNAEIVKIQMKHFENFLHKAIVLGIDRVFIIHGVGKGVLRNMIASNLIQNKDVVTFKNEYHPRYGYGATEVILK